MVPPAQGRSPSCRDLGPVHGSTEGHTRGVTKEPGRERHLRGLRPPGDSRARICRGDLRLERGPALGDTGHSIASALGNAELWLIFCKKGKETEHFLLYML